MTPSSVDITSKNEATSTAQKVLSWSCATKGHSEQRFGKKLASWLGKLRRCLSARQRRASTDETPENWSGLHSYREDTTKVQMSGQSFADQFHLCTIRVRRSQCTRDPERGNGKGAAGTTWCFNVSLARPSSQALDFALGDPSSTAHSRGGAGNGVHPNATFTNLQPCDAGMSPPLHRFLVDRLDTCNSSPQPSHATSLPKRISSLGMSQRIRLRCLVQSGTAGGSRAKRAAAC